MTLQQAIIKVEQLARSQALGSSTTDDIIRILKALNAHNNKFAKLRDMYLDWVNNFGTIDAFAEHYSMTREEAVKTIREAKELYENEIN